MKSKISIGIFLVLFAFGTATAGTLLLPAATSTGPSTKTVHLTEGEKNHNYSCSFLNSTSITAFTVVLQGSIDKKATWSDLSTNAFDATMISQKFGMRHAESKSVDDVRVNITVVTGTDLNAKCYYRAGR